MFLSSWANLFLTTSLREGSGNTWAPIVEVLKVTAVQAATLDLRIVRDNGLPKRFDEIVSAQMRHQLAQARLGITIGKVDCHEETWATGAKLGMPHDDPLDETRAQKLREPFVHL